MTSGVMEEALVTLLVVVVVVLVVRVEVMAGDLEKGLERVREKVRALDQATKALASPTPRAAASRGAKAASVAARGKDTNNQ